MLNIQIEIYKNTSYNIIIPYSNKLDEIYLDKYQNNIKNILFVKCLNNPVGYKFQFLVNIAKIIGFKNIVICGSDDFLSLDYIDNIYKIYKNDSNKKLIYGMNNWYINFNNCVYKTILQNNKCEIVGSGRLLTNEFLEKKNWNIYSKIKSSSIDYSSTYDLTKNNYGIIDNNDMFILSLKNHKYEIINNFNLIMNNLNCENITVNKNYLNLLDYNDKINKIYNNGSDIFCDYLINESEIINFKKISDFKLNIGLKYCLKIECPLELINNNLFIIIYFEDINFLRYNLNKTFNYIEFKNNLCALSFKVIIFNKNGQF